MAQGILDVGAGAVLREPFRALVGTSPIAYQQSFQIAPTCSKKQLVAHGRLKRPPRPWELDLKIGRAHV